MTASNQSAFQQLQPPSGCLLFRSSLGTHRRCRLQQDFQLTLPPLAWGTAAGLGSAQKQHLQVFLSSAWLHGAVGPVRASYTAIGARRVPGLGLAVVKAPSFLQLP